MLLNTNFKIPAELADSNYPQFQEQFLPHPLFSKINYKLVLGSWGANARN